MAAFVRLPSGSWRAVVRRKRKYISQTFRRKRDAEDWVLEAERSIEQGDAPVTPRQVARDVRRPDRPHITDMKEVGKLPGRTKHAPLRMLKREPGVFGMTELDRERIIKFTRQRASSGPFLTP